MRRTEEITAEFARFRTELVHAWTGEARAEAAATQAHEEKEFLALKADTIERQMHGRARLTMREMLTQRNGLLGDQAARPEHVRGARRVLAYRGTAEGLAQAHAAQGSRRPMHACCAPAPCTHAFVSNEEVSDHLVAAGWI